MSETQVTDSEFLSIDRKLTSGSSRVCASAAVGSSFLITLSQRKTERTLQKGYRSVKDVMDVQYTCSFGQREAAASSQLA